MHSGPSLQSHHLSDGIFWDSCWSFQVSNPPHFFADFCSTDEPKITPNFIGWLWFSLPFCRGFFLAPTVQTQTTLPAFQGVMDRLQEVISQELNGFPIILAMPKPAVFDLPFTCQTMKHATTCHHLPKHHPHISSHSRQRPLSTPQRRWDGLAPGKTHAWCTHTKRRWLFQESEVGAQPTSYQTRILPRTLRNHFLEEHACLIQTLVAQRRRSHYHFNFLLLLSFQVPISMELFNIKPFLRVPDTVPLSQRSRTIGEAFGFTQARRTCATLPVAFEKNHIPLLQHAVNLSVVSSFKRPVAY